MLTEGQSLSWLRGHIEHSRGSGWPLGISVARMCPFDHRAHWPPIAAIDQGRLTHESQALDRLDRLRASLALADPFGKSLNGRAQKPRDESQWEYKVFIASYNPGERMTDQQRAASYEQTLNEQAAKGWEPVCTLLSRDTVQTVGGAVTTRDTTAFLAYRRLKR